MLTNMKIHFFKKAFERLRRSYMHFSHSGTVYYNQNQGTICPHFQNHTKKCGTPGYVCSRRGKKKLTLYEGTAVEALVEKLIIGWVNPDLDTLIFGS